MTPYGYEIRDAKAVVVPAEEANLRILFNRFIDGFPLKDCVGEIDRNPQTCKKMLCNPIYLGTDFYPQIIDAELYQRAQTELEHRRKEPVTQPKRIVALPVCTEFIALPNEYTSSDWRDPQAYAEYMYGRIQPQKKAR